MKKRDSFEQFRADALKVARAAIRLKHSIAADNELNERLPDLEDRLTLAYQRGEGFELKAAEEFFDEV